MAAGPDNQSDADTPAGLHRPGGRVLWFGLLGLLGCGIVPLQRGAIYARFSTRYQHSTDDQVRKCREWAEQHGIEVRDQHVFVDEAVTGRSSRRQGLAQLRQALERNEVDVVIALATNRLFRKAYKAAQFVEEEIVDRGKRAVFIDTNIDTADEGRWRQYFQIHSMLDEFTATSTVGHIRASLEGLFLQGRVCNTLPFGYEGQEIEGLKTHKGGTARRVAIDPAEADWVKKAFHWFLQERLSILQIAQRLNGEEAPPPPKVRDGRWSQAAVRRLLGNERYTGRWAYGKTRSTWNNAKSYTRQVLRDKPLKERYVEDWRIIDDVTFAQAQEILAANRHQVAGRKPRDPSIPRPKMLNGLLYCCQHDRPLIVGGNQGSQMFCPDCKKDSQPALYSVLPRELATRRLCQMIASLLQQDTDLVEQVILACQQHIETAGQPDPAEVEALKRKEASLTRNIDRVLRLPGETEEDQAESDALLRELRAERAAVRARMAELQAAASRSATVPSAEQVRQFVDRTAEVLIQAAEGKDPAEWGPARRVLEEITGGKIVVSQQGEAKAKRGWLRGMFRVRVLHLVASHFGCDGAEDGVEVHVDFREPPPNEVIAEQAKALFDQGLLYKDIAKQLNVTRALVIKAIQFWFTSRGLPVPDGRLRRFKLEQQTPSAYLFQQIAEEALALYDQQLPLQEIVRQLGRDHATVSKAIRHALQLRGRPVIDGRTRRRTLSDPPAGSAGEPGATQEADGVKPPFPAAQPDAGPVAADAPAEDARPAA